MNLPNPRHAVLLLCALSLAACSRDEPGDSPRSASQDTPAEHALKHTNPRYRCPMHPQIVRDEPGDCPICGMDLVEFQPEPVAPATTGGTATPREVRISPAVVNNLGVRSEPVTRGGLSRAAQVTGYVAFDERRVRQVRARAEGWVDGLSVRATGETVRQGEPLFTLYSPMLESAQQEFVDALKIGNRDLVDASRDRLRALGIDARTVAALERGAPPAGRVAFHAPVSGVVTEIMAREGAMLSPDMVAMTITELGSLWVIAEVPEAQAGWLERGSHAMVRFPSLPGQTLHGSVDYVYPELNMETRTLRARITLEAPPAGVRANMLANVELMGGQGADVLSIPRNALIRGGGRDRVVVALGDGRFAPRAVVAGASGDERVEIVEGLREGEQVVTAAQFLIDSEASLESGLGRLEDAGGAGTHAPAQPDPHAGH